MLARRKNRTRALGEMRAKILDFQIRHATNDARFPQNRTDFLRLPPPEIIGNRPISGFSRDKIAPGEVFNEK